MPDYPGDPHTQPGQHRTDPDAFSCNCPDPLAHHVAAMVDAGTPLFDACRAVYGPGGEARRIVRAGYAEIPWLRLPVEVVA